MNNTASVEILPEDRVQFTNDQQNLITLALDHMLPPEDADYIQKVKKSAKTNHGEEITDSYAELSGYFTQKYGLDFGMIYLVAITGGEKKYKQVIYAIERENALKRTKPHNS